MATHDGNPPRNPNNGRYLTELEPDDGIRCKNVTEDNLASNCILEDIRGRVDHFFIENRPLYSHVGFGTTSATFSPPGGRPVPSQTPESEYSRNHKRKERCHDPDIGSQGALFTQPIIPDSHSWHELYQQLEAARQDAPLLFSHKSGNGLWASTKTEWTSLGQRRVVPTCQRFFSSEHNQDPRVPDVGSLDNRPENVAKGISHGTSIVQSTKLGMFSSTELSQYSPKVQGNPYSYFEAAPWSVENRRHPFIQIPATESVLQADSPETNYSGTYGYDHQSSVPEGMPETSATSFYSDNDDMMGSFETIREPKLSCDDQSQSIEQYRLQARHESSTIAASRSTPLGARFQFEIREGTPQPVPQPNLSFTSAIGSSSLPAHDAEWLRVPKTQRSHTETVSSHGSTASRSIPDILHCMECFREFRGKFRKGNLARHRRHKHKGVADVMYPCEDDSCEKTFKRQDARLKHYRHHHQHLAVDPVVPRGPQGRRRSSQPHDMTMEQEPQEQVIRNMSQWAEEHFDWNHCV